MSDAKKIKRTALIISGLLVGLLLWLVFNSMRSTFTIATSWPDLWPNIASFEAIIYYWGLTSIFILVISGAIVLAFYLLYSIRKDETPFCRKNVKLLKAIAVLLALFEPFLYFAQPLVQKHFPDPVMTAMFSPYSPPVHFIMLHGIVLISGLIIFCVALVFEYGISLQKQVDETL
jgi:hypothetical protein